MPKSSIEIEIPSFFILPRIPIACFASLVAIVSVISSSRYLGSKPISSRVFSILSTSFKLLNCPIERFIAIRIFGKPISCHFLFWAMAVDKTQSPIGPIRPFFSANWIKTSGGTRPILGWLHLKSASTPIISLVIRSICG